MFNRFGQGSGTYEEDLTRARGYKPVTEKELRDAYSQYETVGLKYGQIKKAYSDELLYKKATETVLAWYKKSKADAAKNAAKVNNPGGVPGGNGPVSPVSGPGGFGGGGPGGPGGPSYGLLPDTALGSSGKNPNLPDILSQSEKDKLSSATNPDVQKLEQRQLKPLTNTQISQIMKSMGAPPAWNPPAAARSSKEALTKWITQAAQKAQLVLRQNAAPILNNTAVAQTMRNLKITGIPVSSVPVQYRTNAKTLTNYLLARSNAMKMAQVAARQRQLTQQSLQTKTVSTATRTNAAQLAKIRGI